MTDDQKIQALWECIQRDADEVAAEAFTLLRQRAEKAERERDAEREAVGLSAEDRDSAIQRAERAEADNAALLDVIRQMKDDDAWGADHPGAALLERMRALESIAQQIIEHWETKPRAGMAYIVMEARMALKETP